MDRRDFLKTTAAVTVAGSLVAAAPPALTTGGEVNVNVANSDGPSWRLHYNQEVTTLYEPGQRTQYVAGPGLSCFVEVQGTRATATVLRDLALLLRRDPFATLDVGYTAMDQGLQVCLRRQNLRVSNQQFGQAVARLLRFLAARYPFAPDGREQILQMAAAFS